MRHMEDTWVPAGCKYHAVPKRLEMVVLCACAARTRRKEYILLSATTTRKVWTRCGMNKGGPRDSRKNKERIMDIFFFLPPGTRESI